MKIYKNITCSREDIERETQRVIKNLFNEFPNGKIENFQSTAAAKGGSVTYMFISNSIIFETEPEQAKPEFAIDNPLILNQFIESLKDLINH